MIAVVAAASAALLVLALLPHPGRGRRAGRAALPLLRWRRGRGAELRQAELEWVEALVGETRAGRDPASAVLAAGPLAHASPAVVLATAAAGSGGDVAAALRSAASASDLVHAVAACWEVAHGSGAGLSASLTALADAARENERVRRDLRAGLAEPKATAWVLAGLPLVGLALGASLGADPLAWLLGTAVGRLVLGAGLLLEIAGAVWSWRIVTALEADL